MTGVSASAVSLNRRVSLVALGNGHGSFLCPSDGVQHAAVALVTHHGAAGIRPACSSTFDFETFDSLSLHRCRRARQECRASL